MALEGRRQGRLLGQLDELIVGCRAVLRVEPRLGDLPRFVHVHLHADHPFGRRLAVQGRVSDHLAPIGELSRGQSGHDSCALDLSVFGAGIARALLLALGPATAGVVEHLAQGIGEVLGNLRFRIGVLDLRRGLHGLLLGRDIHVADLLGLDGLDGSDLLDRGFTDFLLDDLFHLLGGGFRLAVSSGFLDVAEVRHAHGHELLARGRRDLLEGHKEHAGRQDGDIRHRGEHGRLAAFLALLVGVVAVPIESGHLGGL